MELVTDERGVPATRWDGVTMKKSPVTGEDIPDDSARITLERYVNPRKAEWPQADFVVGNPPFIGTKRMKAALGEGYVEALRSTWPEVEESADLVMYWWHLAAILTQHGAVSRFGFITTNSIRQSFNRRTIELALADKKNPIQLDFAIADHPWVDSADGAAVRIAMTVATAIPGKARLATVVEELGTKDGETQVVLLERSGSIHADLRVGANVAASQPLMSNGAIAGMGVALHGSGFILEPTIAAQMRTDDDKVIKPYIAGRDLLQQKRVRYIIDFFGMDETFARSTNPTAFQHVIDYVKPERDHNSRLALKNLWWRFGWERPALRKALTGLPRYIATTETSKHRPFQFLDAKVLADHSIVCISLDQGEWLGVLSSTTHVVWALAAGSRLGVGNDPRYNKTRCFDPFPFPSTNDFDTVRLGSLAEQLDAHRKRQQAAHPDLTLTGMYNVLEKLRSGDVLTAKERVIHEHGLVSVLRQLHDEIDAAVLDAYGWSDLLPLLRVAMGMDARVSRAQDAQERPHGNDAAAEGQTRDDAKRSFDDAILERLVALNAERAAEEARGLVRWLRPEFQNPSATGAPEQGALNTDSDDDEPASAPAAAVKPIAWPKETVDQVRSVVDLLAASPIALSLDNIAARYTSRGAWKKRLPPLLDMLIAVGRAREQDGRYTGTR